MSDSLPPHVRQALNDYYVQTIREIAGRHAPHLLLVASVPDSAVATTGLREVALPAPKAARFPTAQQPGRFLNVNC